MTDNTGIPSDPLAGLLPKDAQQQAARLVQESFAAAFRINLDDAPARREASIEKLSRHLDQWCGMTVSQAQPLRRAVLLNGLDQWGLAFSHVFGAAAMSSLSMLVSYLRDELDPPAEAACQKFLDQMHDDEAAAFEFKVGMRRELHLSLWHTMIATEERDDAFGILQHLGGMLVALTSAMPTLGWRLVADALASIQIRCVAHGLAIEGLPQEATAALFAALAKELPEAWRGPIMTQSSQAVAAWQQARRSAGDA